MAYVSMIQLAAVELIGGTIVFLGFRGKLAPPWSPLFLTGFSFATFIAWMILLEIGSALHKAKVSGW